MDTHTALVKQTATDLGFSHCGIARAVKLDDDARRLETWLLKGHHAGMAYMENHFDLRTDPTKLVPGAKSVITLMLNYFPPVQQDEGIPKISKYAYGKDYHDVIREKLNLFLFRLREKIGDINGRGFVDSAPVLERAWAAKTGLGWVGKNGNLINKQHGSFFFISTLITDLVLQADDPFAKDYCGTCTKCIDHCPTEAILPGKDIDANRCISYLTIELKDMLIPGELSGKFEDWMFGCDICQDVCPWNRFAKPQHAPELEPKTEILHFSFNQWNNLDEIKFRELFKGSPIKRSKFNGIKRNLQFLLDAKPGKQAK